MGEINEDSFILLYKDRRRHWLIRPRETPELHTHIGVVDCRSLIGKEYGVRVSTSLGEELVVLRPTIEDMVIKFARKTQIIYPKDLGMIITKSGIHSGSKVIEAGTGSGATTAFIAYHVMPDGHVYSYELREEFQEIARKNLDRLGLLKYVTLKLKDARIGFDESDIDAAVIDVGDPWDLINAVWRSLRPSGMVAVVTPTVNQAERLVKSMKDSNFVAIETIEILMRHMEIREGMSRPSNIMVAHTAYITFGRKAV